MENYFDVDAYSASAIKAGAVSMLQMEHYLKYGVSSTGSMSRGTLQHLSVLEPDKLELKIVADYDARTKDGKAFLAEHGADNIIKPAEKADMLLARHMVENHPQVKKNRLFESGKAEKECYWKEGEIDCKCKVDWDDIDYFIEYKTTNQIDRFTSAAAGMFYQLQLGWYWRGSGEKRCFVVAQDQKRPFDVAVFEVSQLLLKKWFNQALDIVKKYHSGDRSGAFPDLLAFELPAWANDTEVAFDDTEIINF